MLRRALLCLIAIVIVWMAVDVLLHYWLLAPFYLQNPSLWRPLLSMNAMLIHTVRVSLAALMLAIYWWQIRPKSICAGLLFGALIGLLLGVAVGIGTYIHSPIPQPLMWGWFVGAWIKAALAGVLLGCMLPENAPKSRPNG